MESHLSFQLEKIQSQSFQPGWIVDRESNHIPKLFKVVLNDQNPLTRNPNAGTYVSHIRNQPTLIIMSIGALGSLINLD